MSQTKLMKHYSNNNIKLSAKPERIIQHRMVGYAKEGICEGQEQAWGRNM